MVCGAPALKMRESPGEGDQIKQDIWLPQFAEKPQIIFAGISLFDF
jgi:hypothetical protein